MLLPLSDHRVAIGPRRDSGCYAHWLVIVRAAVQAAACLLFLHAAPLLEEERDISCSALVTKRLDPRGVHRSCAGTAFATNDDPVDTGEIDRAEIFEQWFDGQKAYGGGCCAQLVNARHAVPLVFDAHTPPGVRQCCMRPQRCTQ